MADGQVLSAGLNNFSLGWDEFGQLTERLENAVKRGEPLTDLDWARALVSHRNLLGQ